MASSVISVEWRNQNSLRNYPFREDCGLRPDDSTGNIIEDGWRVPNYLITDLVIGVNSENYSNEIYLKRLSVVNGSVTVTFADSAGEDALTATTSSSDSEIKMTGYGSFIDSCGTICFGNISRFSEELADGIYSFSKEESLIEPSCIRPSAKGVNSIAVEDRAGYVTAGLKGDVKLVAGDNTHIRYEVETNTLIISADPNSGYTDGCDCLTSELSVVRSINGIKTEDVTIVGDDCVNVTTNNGIITITDKCSKPCCGCAETTFINQAINDLQSSVNTLTTNASILSERITSFVNNYLLARKTLG